MLSLITSLHTEWKYRQTFKGDRRDRNKFLGEESPVQKSPTAIAVESRGGVDRQHYSVGRLDPPFFRKFRSTSKIHCFGPQHHGRKLFLVIFVVRRFPSLDACRCYYAPLCVYARPKIVHSTNRQLSISVNKNSTFTYRFFTEKKRIFLKTVSTKSVI